MPLQSNSMTQKQHPPLVMMIWPWCVLEVTRIFPWYLPWTYLICRESLVGSIFAKPFWVLASQIVVRKMERNIFPVVHAVNLTDYFSWSVNWNVYCLVFIHCVKLIPTHRHACLSSRCPWHTQFPQNPRKCCSLPSGSEVSAMND